MTWDDYDYVTCSCCGTLIPDTPEDNADHEKRGQDIGFGMCATCVDWSFDMIFQPMFETVRENLNPDNQAKWDTLSDTQKATAVQKLLDKGVLAWKIGG